MSKTSLESRDAPSKNSVERISDDDFTAEEAQVVADYLDRRLMHLEEDGLTDSYCYPRIYSFRRKLIKKYLSKEHE